MALVQLKLDRDGFAAYRCDKSITLGLSITNLAKVLRLVTGNDSITLKCNTDEPNAMLIICESSKQERVTEFTLNLISLDSESLGIPETSYQSEISMISNDF